MTKMGCECNIVPIRKEEINISLFDKEIDIARFICFELDIGYEQLFVKLTKEYAEREYANNKNYTFPYF